jgi:probable F420-dependent oxidoreductase
MRVGLTLPQYGLHANKRTVTDFALAAETCGFDSLWVQEHLLWPHDPKPLLGAPPSVTDHHLPEVYRYYLSPLELLSYVAAITHRIRIGTSILVTAYHRPVELAKRAATLDVISDGRLTLGLGLGVFPDEYDAAGTPTTQRGARADDFLAAMRTCWGENPVEYRGPFFTIPKADTSPTPVQRDMAGHPTIPIMGAFGHASAGGRTRTAQFCDIYNPVLHESTGSTARVHHRPLGRNQSHGPRTFRTRTTASVLAGLCASTTDTTQAINPQRGLYPDLLHGGLYRGLAWRGRRHGAED